MWSPAKRLHFDVYPFPIVVITVHDGWSAEDLTWMFGEFDKLFARDQRYALVVDTTRAGNAPTANERRLITDWENRCEAQIDRLSVGCAVVFSSALIRGALTAMSWIVKRGQPVTYVASTAEAGRWCMERLHAASQRLTVECRGYLLTRGVQVDWSDPPAARRD